ncbi:hypothetical protein A2U01_0119007, partial [Trifolium medium]|nr:hypothetical protein [Trifolium medium]
MRDGLRLLEPVALVLEDPPTSSSLPLLELLLLLNGFFMVLRMNFR